MSMPVSNDLFAALAARYPGIQPDRRGYLNVPCPVCGKEPARGQVHFGFNARGGRCFVCGYHAGLRSLAAKLAVDATPTWTPPPARIVVDAPWQRDAAAIVARTLAHPDRLARWAAYKPLSPATLDKHQFGLSPLPFQRANGEWYWSRTDWLTVPLYDGNKLVGLRGRNLGTEGPKWISATGSHYALWNLSAVQPGSIVWLCENYVDAAWLMERHPDQVALALGGASNWQPAWTQALAARQPRLVVVALDNDLAGQATGAMYARLQAERRAAHPNLPDLVPNGPQIANALNAAGVTAVLFSYPPNAPAKADIGWVLRKEVES